MDGSATEPGWVSEDRDPGSIETAPKRVRGTGFLTCYLLSVILLLVFRMEFDWILVPVLLFLILLILPVALIVVVQNRCRGNLILITTAAIAFGSLFTWPGYLTAQYATLFLHWSSLNEEVERIEAGHPARDSVGGLIVIEEEDGAVAFLYNGLIVGPSVYWIHVRPGSDVLDHFDRVTHLVGNWYHAID